MPHSGLAPASNTALSYVGEQAFHQVRPASAGGREVHVIARMPRQPSLLFANLVGTEIVHHQMNLESLGQTGFDLVEKVQELLKPIAPVAALDAVLEFARIAGPALHICGGLAAFGRHKLQP